ncbi:MAG TPA: DUF3971 domain-containing protein, partial [Stellaceae bacterium]|nr:DUF3971 domain-containing protein [Stellaceae bacterium]
MNQIVIRGATLVLDDRGTRRHWQADRVDASMKRGTGGWAGDASLALALGQQHPELHARYRYAVAEHTLDLALDVGAIVPAALASLSPEFAPLSVADFPVSGTLTTHFNLAALTGEGARIDLYFGKGSIRSELLPGGSVALQQGVLRAVYAPESSELRLVKVDLDLGDGSAVTVNGKLGGLMPALLAGTEAAPASLPGQLGIVLADVPVAQFESLWPPALSPGGRRWVLANIRDGVLDQAAVQLDLAVNPAARTAEVVSAHGTMRFHDATVSYFDGLNPVRKASGTAALADKQLLFTPTGGAVKSVQITGGSLLISDLGAPVEWLTADLSFAGPIRDVLETIDAKPLRYAHDIGLDPARVAGRTKAKIHFKLPLLRDLKLDQVQYGVKATLTGAAIADVAMHRDLSDGNFTVEIAQSGVHLQGASRFDGVPLSIDANMFFTPVDGARGRYRVAMSLSDEERRRLAFDFLADRIAGPVGVDLTYSVIDESHAEANAVLDLHGTSLSLGEAGWRKPPGAPAVAKFVADLHNDRVTQLRDIEVTAAGLDGKFAITLEPDTERIARADIRRLVIAEDDIAGSVMRRRDGGWRVDVHGSNLDVSHWVKELGKDGSRQSASADPPLQINARLGRVVLGPRRELHNVEARLLRDGANWRPAQIEGRFPNGHQLSLRSTNGAGRRNLAFRSDDLGATLSLLDVTDNIIGGRVTVTGQITDQAGKEVVAGHIDGEDYSLVHAPALARIL